MVNAAAVVSTHTIAGETFRCSARTAAHLRWTIVELAAQHPLARLRIIQPCYNIGVAASEGTHDFDAVFDFEIVGLGWWEAQKFLRRCGWAAWFRHLGAWANKTRWHLHAISLGFPGKVGKYIDGGLSTTGRKQYSSQVDDYYNHAMGLAGQHRKGSDTSWFPPSIKDTVFDYPAYLARQAAASSSYLDLTVALARFADVSKSATARKLYLSARSVIAPLVSGSEKVKAPATVAQVVAALVAKRTVSKSVATKARLTAAITLLRPLA